jgi:hypothetical protein
LENPNGKASVNVVYSNHDNLNTIEELAPNTNVIVVESGTSRSTRKMNEPGIIEVSREYFKSSYEKSAKILV